MSNAKLNNLLKAMNQELTYNEANKAQFKKTSTAFLRDIGKQMGFAEMKVSFNPGGIAVPGDPSLYGMWSDGNGIAIYIQAETFGSGQNVLYRTIKSMKDFRGGHNQYTSLERGTDALLETFLRLNKEAV